MFSCPHADYHSHKGVELLCRTLHAANAVSFQEVVSAIPALVLNVGPGHTVLDMCAAPGSKTLQVLDAMLSGGWGAGVRDSVLIASEKDRTKATQTLPARLKRYHAPNVMCTRCDGTQWPQLYQRSSANEWAIEKRFDRIVCDVPCSGDGTVRKEPSVASTWSSGYVKSLVPVQKALLRRGLDLLEVDGVLVYSTCSINPKEDEEVVCAGLELFGDCVELLDVNRILSDKGVTLHSQGGILSPNVEELRNKLVPPSYNGAKVLRVLPHRDNTGGFFVAAFRKLKQLNGSLEPAQVVKKLNQWTKGKLWAPVKRDDDVWQNILSFYDIDGDSPDNFVYASAADGGDTQLPPPSSPSPSTTGLVPLYNLNPHGNATKRIVLATPALAAMVLETRPYKGPGVEVISVGVRAFEAYDGKFVADAACRWRAVVESATFLAPRMARRKLLLCCDSHGDIVREILTAGSVSLQTHWGVLLSAACARLNRGGGNTLPFVKPGGPLASALRDRGTAAAVPAELEETLYRHVEVGPVLVGLARRDDSVDEGSEVPWFVSATLSGGKLELAIDGALRTFGLLTFFGEQPQAQAASGAAEADIAERSLL